MESGDRQAEDGDKKNKTSRYHLSRKRGRPSIAESSNIPKLFKCGCGKDYSTNGALFSHTRIKHGGVQPPGSTRMRNTNRKPRKDCGISRKIKTEKGGRRREDGFVMSSWEVDLLALLNSTVGGRDQSLERSVIDVIAIFEKQNPPLPELPESKILKKTFLELQNQLISMIEGGMAQKELDKETPSDIFERDLWRVINHFKHKGWKMNIYITVCLFTYTVCRFSSLSFLAEIMALLSVFMNFINTEGGQEVSIQILKTEPSKEKRDYCESHDSEYLPELASAFMKYRYSSKIGLVGTFEENAPQFNLFGKTSTHLLRAMHLFSLMISWLNSHELSNCEWLIEDLPKLDHPHLLEPQQVVDHVEDPQSKLEDEEIFMEDTEDSDAQEEETQHHSQLKSPAPQNVSVETRTKSSEQSVIISEDEAQMQEKQEPAAVKQPKVEDVDSEIAQYLVWPTSKQKPTTINLDNSFEEGQMYAFD